MRREQNQTNTVTDFVLSGARRATAHGIGLSKCLTRLMFLVMAAFVFSASSASASFFFDLPVITKSFDGPGNPGGIVVLSFTITNTDINFTMVEMTFEDDLDAMLSGVEAIGLPQTDVCGAGSTFSGTSNLVLTDGRLGAGESCTFEVTLQIPSDAAVGSYVNETTEVSGTMAENPHAGFIGAFADLFIEASPEINVTGNGIDIADGDTSPRSADHTDFGTAALDGGSVTRTFTIENIGSGDLTLGANSASLSGTNASDFSIVTQPDSTVAGSDSTTVVVKFDPSATGSRNATLSITNDDSDESPYNFSISGNAGSTAGITIVQNITGDDTKVRFSSSTSALNFSLRTQSGSAETSVSGVAAGTHVVQAENLESEGYAIVGIACDDGNSTGDVDSRSATIKLADGESVTCVFETVESGAITTQTIDDYLNSRNSLLLIHLPDIGRRLNRLTGGQTQGTAVATLLDVTGSVPFPMDVQISQNVFGYAASSRNMLGLSNPDDPDAALWDVWSEGYFSWFDDGAGGTGTVGVLYAGVDYLLTSDILLGMQVEVDWTSEDFSTTGGSVDGTGWMAGPYGLIRLGEDFYFDFSASWGQSSNQISPLGTYTDTFTTNRWLIYGGLIGEVDYDKFTVRPALTFKYIEDYQHAYTDSLNVAIGAQTVSQGEIAFAPRFSYTETLDDGTMLIPWIEVGGVYTFNGAGMFTGGAGPTTSNFSGSVEVGLDIDLASGAFLMISGQYDGLGTAAHSVGMSAGVSASF